MVKAQVSISWKTGSRSNRREAEMRRSICQEIPYAAPESLPAAVRADLPLQEQQLYCDTFNSAWRRYADFADREAFCHRMARSAVRRHLSVAEPPESAADTRDTA